MRPIFLVAPLDTGSSGDQKLDKPVCDGLGASTRSEDIFLEDMLLEAIDDAIEVASKAGDLNPTERLNVIEKASDEFMKRVEKTVAQIILELS